MHMHLQDIFFQHVHCFILLIENRVSRAVRDCETLLQAVTSLDSWSHQNNTKRCIIV